MADSQSSPTPQFDLGLNLDSIDESRFKRVTEEELTSIEQSRNERSTQTQTVWAVKAFKDWMQARGKGTHFEQLQSFQLNYLLRSFYAEARTTKGERYSKIALTGLRAGLNRYLRSSPHHRQICLMTDKDFTSSNQLLSGLVKKLKRAGADKTKHKQPISQPDLEKLQASSALGLDTPQSLQNKIYFDLAFQFGRRGREGLRALKKSSFVIKSDADGHKYIIPDFNEAEKNHSSDSYQCQARVYETPNAPDTCPVRAFELYLSKLHPEQEALFQRPKPEVPAKGPWYCNAPLGVHSLGDLMKNISKKAGLSTTYTNHCVRATTCVQLDRAGYDTQQIMAITGHRNEASVRSYTNRMQPERAREVSHTLSRYVPIRPAPATPETIRPAATPPNQMSLASTSTTVEEAAVPVPSQASLFSGCIFHGSVTVNYTK